MKCRAFVGALISFLVVSLSAHGDSVFVRGKEKPINGEIKSEDAKGIVIVVKKADETIPAKDIVDVQYDGLKPVDLNLSGGAYKYAKDADKELMKEGLDPVKRKAAYVKAIKGYGDTLKAMQPHKYAARQFEYKVALLTVQQALAEQLPVDKGIKKLQDFKTTFPNSWQVSQIVPLIAQLQLDSKDYKGAELTFQEIAEMAVFSAEVRREAELKVVEISLKAGNIDQAQKRIESLFKKATGDPAFTARIKMEKAKVLVGQKKMDEAVPLLHQIIKDSDDRQVRAIAHNTLGECLHKAARYNEALWEFLWVDTVYNQDKSQHAKSLYYLWDTFDKLNNGERAQECREMLMNSQFAGTEYQQRALLEKKK